ncbi:unnamed protein product [Bursaphelenchus xylophilus]|uniref:(pine wood nematode) hypothetical protein n=1 Tax=Bursaphelenchus xylophilus TaxID=6326 RepID=A0A1I7RMN7_BURXY|nr:unnamed protein product [Bursaphelenchus xylophilus]CAG9125635.1 unnamed protein product [Bursaphelenchus xylophilus]
MRESRPIFPIQENTAISYPGQCEQSDFLKAVTAASEGDVTILDEMIKLHGRNMVNWKSNDNQSLLHYAVRHERLNVVKFLVENRAEINVYDSMLNTVFHYGARFQSPQCMKYLLKLLKGLARNKLGDMKLEKGNLEIAKRLLDDPAIDGRTPLHYSAMHRDAEIAGMILRALYVLFDPEDFIKAATRLDSHFHTAAHIACRYKSINVLRLFIDPYECFRTIGEGRGVCKAMVIEIHKRLQTPDIQGRCFNPKKKKTEVKKIDVRKNLSLAEPVKFLKRAYSSRTREEMAKTMMKMRHENERLRYELDKIRSELNKENPAEPEEKDCFVEVQKNVIIQLPSIDLDKLDETEQKEHEDSSTFPSHRIQESVTERFKNTRIEKMPSDSKISRPEFNSSELRSIYTFSSLSSLENSDFSAFSDP